MIKTSGVLIKCNIKTGGCAGDKKFAYQLTVTVKTFFFRDRERQ